MVFGFSNNSQLVDTSLLHSVSPLVSSPVNFREPREHSKSSHPKSTLKLIMMYLHEVRLRVKHASAYGVVVVAEADDVETNGLRYCQDE